LNEILPYSSRLAAELWIDIDLGPIRPFFKNNDDVLGVHRPSELRRAAAAISSKKSLVGDDAAWPNPMTPIKKNILRQF